MCCLLLQALEVSEVCECMRCVWREDEMDDRRSAFVAASWLAGRRRRAPSATFHSHSSLSFTSKGAVCSFNTAFHLSPLHVCYRVIQQCGGKGVGLHAGPREPASVHAPLQTPFPRPNFQLYAPPPPPSLLLCFIDTFFRPRFELIGTACCPMQQLASLRPGRTSRQGKATRIPRPPPQQDDCPSYASSSRQGSCTQYDSVSDPMLYDRVALG